MKTPAAAAELPDVKRRWNDGAARRQLRQRSVIIAVVCDTHVAQMLRNIVARRQDSGKTQEVYYKGSQNTSTSYYSYDNRDSCTQSVLSSYCRALLIRRDITCFLVYQ